MLAIWEKLVEISQVRGTWVGVTHREPRSRLVQAGRTQAEFGAAIAPTWPPVSPPLVQVRNTMSSGPKPTTIEI